MPSFLLLHLCVLCAAAGIGFAAPAAAPKGALANIRLDVASQWEAKGEYDKAVQELRLYLSEHPENPGAIYARVGGLRLKQGNYKLAGENFKIALAKDSTLADARAGLALAYEKQGYKAKADEERKKLAAMTGAKPSPAQPGAAAAVLAKPVVEPAGSAKPGTAGPAKPKSASDDLPPPAEHNEGAGAAPSTVARPAPAAHTLVPNQGGEDAYSPALDSGASHGPTGIYADKDFLAALEAYKAGKLDAMAAPLRRCLSRHPGHPGAYYLGGVMRYDKGDFGKAIYNFKRALAYPDRGFNAHFYLGRIYQRQERFPLAAAEFREYLKATASGTGRKQAEAYLAQMGEGNAPATQDGKAQAAPALKETTAKEAAHEGGMAQGGGDSIGKPDATAHPAPSAAKSAPVPPAEAKALVLGRDGSFLFLIPDPESASGKKLNEAHALAKNEKYENAVGALKDVMLKYGGSDNARAADLDLASVYLQLGLWDQARECADDQTRQGAGDSAKFYDAARYLAALADLGMKDGGKAEKALLKIKPGAPDGPAREEVDYRLTQAGALLNDPKKQSGYLEKAYANAKDPVRKAGYARDMGGLHAKYGALDKALGWYGKAASECKDAKDSVLAELCAEVQLRMADLAYRKKDWRGAMGQYRRFAAQWPRHKEAAWVHYQMANIYKATGNFESALNEYKRVIDNYPDSYWASQAKWNREDAIWRKEYEEVLN